MGKNANVLHDPFIGQLFVAYAKPFLVRMAVG